MSCPVTKEAELSPHFESGRNGGFLKRVHPVNEYALLEDLLIHEGNGDEIFSE
jgi:hypothetical protein